MEEPREIEEAEEDNPENDKSECGSAAPRSKATAEHFAKVDVETAFLTCGDPRDF
jgi:hypothetical protein